MSSDPTTWGVQPNGWVTPTAAEILERMELDEKSTIGPEIDVDPDGMVGQINGIVAAELGSVWEAAGALEAARSRDGAEGAMLDSTGKLTGTSRDGATATKIPCTVGLDAGTTLTVDNLASVAGHPEITFYPLVDKPSGFTAPTTTTYTIIFVCTETGPTVVSPSTLTVITTPLSGWTSITNPTAGVIGTEIDSDADFRLEQEVDLSAAGSATAVAIASDLVYDEADGTGVLGVLSAYVLENDTDVTDVNGLPPHSIECVLHTDGTEASTDVAEAIWNAKPAGCNTYGAFSAVYKDVRGDSHTVYYSKVTAKPVYLAYTLSKGTDYVGDTALKAAIVLDLTARSTVGVDVNAVYTQALPMRQQGVNDVTAFAQSFSGPPAGATNLTIGIREIATFDASRITIT